MRKGNTRTGDFWIYSAVLCLGLLDTTQGQTCTAIDQCSCKLEDGKVITLWDIDRRYQIQSFISGFTYLYSPCTGLSEPHSDCDGALGCQLAGSQKTAIAYSPRYIDAVKDSGSGLYMFKYYGSMDAGLKKKIQLNLLLQCDEKKDAEFNKMLGCEAGVCILTLNSKCACPGTCRIRKQNGNGSSRKLSTGSVLCIVLLVLLLVYLIAGVAINKYALHKEGSDVMPHKTLWTNLFSLSKDGCVFTYRKIRGGKGDYQQI